MVLLRTAIQGAVPLYAGRAIDNTGIAAIPGRMPQVLGIMAGLGVITGLMRTIYRYGAKVQDLVIGKRVTIELFAKIARAPLEKISAHPASYWQNRIQGDVGALGPLYPHNLVLRLSSVLTVVIFSVFLCQIHWQLFLALVLTSPISVVTTLALRKQMRGIKEKRMEISAANGAWLADTIAALPLVKLSGAEEREVAELDRRLGVGVREAVRLERLRILGGALSMVARWAAPVVVYGWGFLLVKEGALGAGDMVSFAMFSALVANGIQSTVRASATVDDGLVAMGRLRGILSLVDEAERFDRRSGSQPLVRRIVFEDVSFAYPPPQAPEVRRRSRARSSRAQEAQTQTATQPVLRSVNLQLDMGNPAILVGASGSGKSTLMKLLCGLYSPDSGRILVDGVDLRDLDVHAYRQQLCQMSHDGFVLGRSFQENALYRCEHLQNTPDRFPPALAELLEALQMEKVGSRDLLEIGRRRKRLAVGEPDLLPDDLKAPGVLQLSAGERQRLGLIRELLHGGHLWGLDEATCNLDGALEDRVLDMILARKDLLLLAVSHRYSCIRRFSTIHVMHEGQIVATGSHDELLATTPEYSHLVKPQMVSLPKALASHGETDPKSSRGLITSNGVIQQ